MATDTIEVQRGPAMLNRQLWLVRGVEKRLAGEPDVELVPILWGTSLPGGGYTRRAYETVRDEAAAALRAAGPLDGVVVANHGAMEVRGMDAHPDTDFLDHVAAAVGADVPLALCLDLHGHLTQGMLDRIVALAVLRTAPHRDDEQTGYRATDQLLAHIRSGQRQKIARVHIPLLLPGEMAMTTASPARELYAKLADYDRRDGMVEANLMVGFAWNDKPWVGMSAIAQSARSEAQAIEIASEIARDVWAAREDFVLRMEHCGLSEGLDRAAAAPERPLFLTDAGDNTTAGAPGCLTDVLVAILARPDLGDVVVAGIMAPKTLAACRAAGVGATVTLALGAEHLPPAAVSHPVEAVVEAFGDALIPSGPQPYLRRGGPWVRVRIGHVIATFHDAPVGITTPSHLAALGIHPTDHRIYVVKLGYLHPYLEDAAARVILLMTDGAANLDLSRLEYTAVTRPSYPLDPDATFDPAANLITNARRNP